jgi:hypothetical protein
VIPDAVLALAVEEAYKPRAASGSRGLHRQACPDRGAAVARSWLVLCANMSGGT